MRFFCLCTLLLSFSFNTSSQTLEKKVIVKLHDITSYGEHKEFRLKTATENYLNLAQTLYKKINTFKSVFKVNTIHQYSLLLELEYCSKMPAKHIDLAERRLLKGEKIPYSEKVFSLFEPHTKWINKGKAGVIAEPGQKHLIITDQNHFIVYHRLTGDTPDAEFTVKTAKEVKKQFGNRLTSPEL